MTNESKTCWLCGRNGTADPLDKHHIFGGANRRKSEKYGLCVYLCHHDCHIFGTGAAHRNRRTMERLHEYGQEKAMREQGWSAQEFVLIFGKNYLDEAPVPVPASVDGFRILPEPEPLPY